MVLILIVFWDSSISYINCIKSKKLEVAFMVRGYVVSPCDNFSDFIKLIWVISILNFWAIFGNSLIENFSTSFFIEIAFYLELGVI